MMTPEEFLTSHGFILAEDIDRTRYISLLTDEMKKGLNKEPSSLGMYWSFITPKRRTLAGKRVAVLDAGGTNFRGGIVEFGKGISEFKLQPMPGAEQEVSEAEFYQAFKDEVKRLLPNANVPKVGWCFSYPAETTPELDAKLIKWTKNIKAPAIVGQLVGEKLGVSVSVVNDTVATLLAADATANGKAYSSYIGFILGTGTNAAYVDPKLQMVINAESGNFDKFPQSDFDKAVDQKSGNPGHQFLEKMIAGAYLGDIGLEILKSAARAGYFSKAGAGIIMGKSALSTKDLSEFCDGTYPTRLDADDTRIAVRFVLPVFERAATLAAIELAAFVIQSGGGYDENEPVAICIDGSTYYKTSCIDFPSVVKHELDEILVRQRNVHYEIVPKVDDAPMYGAAIAALS